MKRDMDPIRELLLKLEARPVPHSGIEWIVPDRLDIQVPGHDIEAIGYHLSLLEQAGLVEAEGMGFGISPGPGIAFRGLSWAGHDFLDTVRSADVWDKTSKVARAVGGLTVDLLMATAKTYLETKIKGLVGG
ncbi:hypothetical protein BLA13014_08264 [Burkholderia aenigmatica]|uniref:DUF2513 domain-containing protein n=1 Tax=Burkholderia aenigmatica TaxID=2015348 RepID=A0A6P2T661_9BURK|nr:MULTISPECIES: DUF2513 domain-containing protein [Burkholderia]VWC53801.1 hypothetical protein BLA13014_08264 [Burkholderia aenigmatica]